MRSLEHKVASVQQSISAAVPALMRPRPYKVMIAITAACNARCEGCRYGRDFMVGERLSLEVVKQVLDDARAAGFHSIRLYGGEPLLHPDLEAMVAHAVSIGLVPYVTTNGALLAEKIDGLYEAGLRDLTFGFYGVGEAYDEYTGRPGLFEKVERGIAAVRERYGDEFELQMNYLLKRPSCSVADLHASWDFSQRYDMQMRVDLVHYSLPYFQEGPERSLQFREGDRPLIQPVIDELLRLKGEFPHGIAHTVEGIRSIPDWLVLGPDMKVPCTAYDMMWVGADGSVQMCYVTFPLGNVHETRFRDLLFTKEHTCAARDALALRCPNCHCSSNERVMRHGPSRRRYRA